MKKTKKKKEKEEKEVKEEKEEEEEDPEGEEVVEEEEDVEMKKEENNLILLQKGNDELTEIVNKSLAKAYEAGYYPKWYAEAQELAGLDTAQEVVIPDSSEAAN